MTLIVLIVILSKLKWRVLNALFQSVLRGSTFSLYQWNGNTTYHALQNLCRNVVDAVTWSENSWQKVKLVIPFQYNRNLEHLEVRKTVCQMQYAGRRYNNNVSEISFRSHKVSAEDRAMIHQFLFERSLFQRGSHKNLVRIKWVKAWSFLEERMQKDVIKSKDYHSQNKTYYYAHIPRCV